MAKLNNNETHKLLELSDLSESEIDLPELIATPRKKRTKRKLRRSRTNNISHVHSSCMCNIRIFTVVIAAILLTIWIITLTWLAIVLHSELQRLDSTVREVILGYQPRSHFPDCSMNKH